MSSVVWNAANGWHDGPKVGVALDDRGRIAIVWEERNVCDCCALMIANGDDSSCRDYYGHDHPTCNLPWAVIDGDPEEVWSCYVWTCDGCGSDMLSGANRWNVLVDTTHV